MQVPRSHFISLSVNCMVTQWRHAPVETSWLFLPANFALWSHSLLNYPKRTRSLQSESDWPKPGPQTIFMASHAKASQYFLTSGSAALVLAEDDENTCGDLDEGAWRGSGELQTISTPHEEMSSHCLHFTNSYLLYLRNSTTRIFISSPETWKRLHALLSAKLASRAKWKEGVAKPGILGWPANNQCGMIYLTVAVNNLLIWSLDPTNLAWCSVYQSPCILNRWNPKSLTPVVQSRLN